MLVACGCSCPLVGGTFCAVSQKCTRTILGSDMGPDCFFLVLRGERSAGECVFLVYPLLAGLVHFERDFDSTGNPLHTLWGYRLNLVHVYGRGCVRWVILISLCLITLGGDVIMLFGTLYRAILVKIITSSGARVLHHDGRVMETAFLLGCGRGAGDLGGQGQGGLWLRQERAGGRGGGWVAAVVVGRGGACCVSCCVCFLRRGGRCPCCADR